MNDFIKKWKEDKKYRTKIKLLAYTLFVVIVSIYAFTLDNKPNSNFIDELKETNKTKQNNKDTIEIPEEYDYTINISIDDKEYKYIGKKNIDSEYIEKVVDNKTTNYMFKDGKYYIEDNLQKDNYIITTKDEVYDVINYNYINLNTINEYLSSSTKDSDQYLVYLKDVILGNDSEDYFVININDKKIFIDYTVLMKEFNKDINKYQVMIEIKPDAIP